jgi:hypothetical protein
LESPLLFMEFSQTAFFASTNKYLDELLDES